MWVKVESKSKVDKAVILSEIRHDIVHQPFRLASATQEKFGEPFTNNELHYNVTFCPS